MFYDMFLPVKICRRTPSGSRWHI